MGVPITYLSVLVSVGALASGAAAVCGESSALINGAAVSLSVGTESLIVGTDSSALVGRAGRVGAGAGGDSETGDRLSG